MKPQSIFAFIAGSLTGIFLWMKFKPGKKAQDAASTSTDSSAAGGSAAAPPPATDSPSITPTAGAGTTDTTATVTPGAATPEVIHSIAAGEPMSGGYPTEGYTEAPTQAPVGVLVPIAVTSSGMSDPDPWVSAPIIPIAAVSYELATMPAEDNSTTSGGGGTGANGAKVVTQSQK